MIFLIFTKEGCIFIKHSLSNDFLEKVLKEIIEQDKEIFLE